MRPTRYVSALFSCALTLTCLPAIAQQPALTADAIMARVASNQDAAETERAHYIYTQHAHIASRKGKTVHCEETTDYRIAPSASGSDRQLLKLDGRLLQKHGYVTYTQLPTPKRPTSKDANGDDKDAADNIDMDAMDRDLVENMRKNLTEIHHSKDGIGANLFPLSSKEQADYTFTLLGRETRNGRDTFHITFGPKNNDDFTWKGDAWIDATAFQPVVVRTTMARKIPFAVRALLGTNVPGLGFTIVYAPRPPPPPLPTLPPSPPSGSPPPLAPSSRSTSSSSSTAKSSSTLTTATSKEPTSPQPSTNSPNPQNRDSASPIPIP